MSLAVTIRAANVIPLDQVDGPVIHQFPTEKEGNSWIAGQAELAATIKQGRVKKDPAPSVPAVGESWSPQDIEGAFDAITRLQLAIAGATQPELVDRAARLAMVEPLLPTLGRLESLDRQVIAMLARQLWLEEHLYREYHYKFVSANQRATRMVKPVVFQPVPGWWAELMPWTFDWLNTFHVQNLVGVTGAEADTIRYAYRLADEAAGIPVRYHAHKVNRGITRCTQPYCIRQHSFGVNEAYHRALAYPVLNKKEQRAYEEMLAQKPSIDEQEAIDTLTQFDRTVQCCEQDEDGQVVVELLKPWMQETVQPVDSPEIRDQLRDVIRETVARREDGFESVRQWRDGIRRAERTISHVCRLAQAYPDDRLLQAWCALIAAYDPSTRVTGVWLPSVCTIMDTELEARFPVEPQEQTLIGSIDTLREYVHRERPDARGFVIIDTEVTDLLPSAGDIIEIALVFTDRQGRPIDRVSWLIHNDHDAQFVGMESVHRISPEQMQKGMSSEISARIIAQLIDGFIPVGHNAGFDKRYVDTLLDRFGLPVTPVWVDTMQLFKELVEAEGQTVDRKTLDSMCTYLGVQFGDDHHAAEADTTVTGHCVMVMLNRFAALGRGIDWVNQSPPTVMIDLGLGQVASRYVDPALWSAWGAASVTL